MTIQYVDLHDAQLRIAAILAEVNTEVGTILGIDYSKVPVIRGSSYGESRPIWQVSIQTATPQLAGIAEADQLYEAVITLKLGKTTAGSKGKLEEYNEVFVPFTLAWFKGTPMLQSATYQTEPDDLLETDITLAQMGVMVDDEIGAEFRLSLPYVVSIPVRY